MHPATKTASGKVDWTKATDGTGDDAEIDFDPMQKTLKADVRDPVTGNIVQEFGSEETMLAHELIHTALLFQGIMDVISPVTNTYIDQQAVPATSTTVAKAATSKSETILKEEAETIGLPGHAPVNKATENSIRDEQGQNQRAGYKLTR